MIIDATNTIRGRLATKAAKAALMSEDVVIVNCKDAIVSGDRKTIIAKYARIRSMGIPAKGPFLHRRADMIVKRTIRGMVPYKQPKGMNAFKRIKCYVDTPEQYQGKAVKVEGAEVGKLPVVKFMTVGELCKILGGKE